MNVIYLATDLVVVQVVAVRHDVVLPIQGSEGVVTFIWCGANLHGIKLLIGSRNPLARTLLKPK